MIFAVYFVTCVFVFLHSVLIENHFSLNLLKPEIALTMAVSRYKMKRIQNQTGPIKQIARAEPFIQV